MRKKIKKIIKFGMKNKYSFKKSFWLEGKTAFMMSFKFVIFAQFMPVVSSNGLLVYSSL